MSLEMVLLWTVDFFLWVIALGFAICVVLALYWMGREIRKWWRDGRQPHSGTMIWGLGLVAAVCAGIGTGLFFAAIQIWRSLLP